MKRLGLRFGKVYWTTTFDFVVKNKTINGRLAGRRMGWWGGGEVAPPPRKLLGVEMFWNAVFDRGGRRAPRPRTRDWESLGMQPRVG